MVQRELAVFFNGTDDFNVSCSHYDIVFFERILFYDEFNH